MPEPSTFRNHDAPRGPRACGRGRRAGRPGGQRVLRGWPCASGGLSLRSAFGPAYYRSWSSRHGRGRTAGGPKTSGRSACIVVLEFPVVLGEAEELDIAATWPHPGQDRRYLVRCAALGRCPKKARSGNSGPSFYLRPSLPASLAAQPSHRHFLACLGPWAPVILVEKGPRHAGGDIGALVRAACEPTVMLPSHNCHLAVAEFVARPLHAGIMEHVTIRLTMGDDRLGADLFVATPFRLEDADDLLAIFGAIDVRTSVPSVAHGASRWLLRLRVSESDASRLSATRASAIVREVNQKLTSEPSIGLD